MVMRTTVTTVTIKEPFELAGLPGKRPAGDYEIELQEQMIDNAAFLAYRRMSTRIHLPSDDARLSIGQQVMIDPVELAGLLLKRQPPHEPVVHADPDHFIIY